ncbi:hypothetical protein ABEV34_14020 [Methylorubrum rhodesianum]|uniref:hypothetical protein n=1 Tax=Methylorubrum TaxID=2282523 RepID=UPI001616252B|nr:MULTISPECIES: hypothetical protein [Methylorubrum]MBB5764193.1 hypothetical protein [Methylorubrum rhodesianum]MBI1690112.1 hypothetical protein [Methylorubrum sp. DB1722]
MTTSQERCHVHCTDGLDVVFDLKGRAVSDEDLRPVCATVAFELMQSCAAPLDWSAWIVDVHDAYGQHVMTMGFDEIANEVGCLPALAA